MAFFHSNRPGQNHNSLLYIIAASVAASLVVYFQAQGGNEMALYRLILSPYVFITDQYWQFVTHFFLVPQPFTLAIKMLFLWFVGATLEAAWGTKRFLMFVAICVAGSIAAWALLFFGFSLGGWLFGPGAALLGFIWVFSRRYPDQQFYLFFILPVKAKYFLLIYIGIRVLLGGSVAFIQLLMELGGAGLGVAWLWYIEQRSTLKRKARLKPLQAKQTDNDTKNVSKHSVLRKTILQGLEEPKQTARAISNLEEQTSMPAAVTLCPPDDFDENDNYCLECEGYAHCLRRKYYSRLKKKNKGTTK